MKKLNSFISLKIRKLILIFIELLGYRKINKNINLIKKHYNLAFIERKIQNKKKLIKLIKFVSENNKFYQNFFKKNNVKISKIERDLKYFYEVPVLDKNYIINNYSEYIESFKDKKKFKVNTSGSTGKSFEYFIDENLKDRSTAITAYSRFKIGKTFLDKELHFASDFGQVKNIFFSIENFKNKLLNRKNIFYKFFDENLLFEFEKMNSLFRPKLVHAQPSILNFIANESKKNNKKIQFDIFESSGELLSKSYKNNINKTFNCLIINRYGLAEFGVIAYQLNPLYEDLKIFDSSFWVESDSENRIIVTDLENYFSPLIRYCTGDLGDIEKKDDGVYIVNIIGRQHHNLNYNGKILSTNYLMDTFEYVIGNILDFQIHLKNNKYLLNLVLKDPKKKIETENRINQLFPNLFDINLIDYRDLELSGSRNKFSFLIK